LFFALFRVHKKVLMVVVIDATTPEEKPERRRFATLPSDLRQLSSWLQAQDDCMRGYDLSSKAANLTLSCGSNAPEC
jgi:hypothetical protein